MNSLPFFAVPLGAALLFLFIRHAASGSEDGLVRSVHVRLRAWSTGRSVQEVQWALDQRDTQEAARAAHRETEAMRAVNDKIDAVQAANSDSEAQEPQVTVTPDDLARQLGFSYEVFGERFQSKPGT